MSVVHDDDASWGAALQHPPGTLLRRLMITCAVTGLPSDTGFELHEIPAVSANRQVLVDCAACGQDHGWRIEDVFLD